MIKPSIKMSTYLQVAEDDGEEPIEVPTEDDGSLLLSTLCSQFPGTSGLRFRNPDSERMRGVRIVDGRFHPPDNGWGSNVYFCVFPKGLHSENSTAKAKVLKVQFNEEIRRVPIHNEDITYDKLLLMIQKVFSGQLKPDDDITIKYQDEDGDMVTIFDSAELSEMLMHCRVLKVKVSVKEKEPEVACGQPPNGGTQLQHTGGYPAASAVSLIDPPPSLASAPPSSSSSDTTPPPPSIIASEGQTWSPPFSGTTSDSDLQSKCDRMQNTLQQIAILMDHLNDP